MTFTLSAREPSAMSEALKPGAIGGPPLELVVSVKFNSISSVNIVEQTFEVGCTHRAHHQLNNLHAWVAHALGQVFGCY